MRDMIIKTAAGFLLAATTFSIDARAAAAPSAGAPRPAEPYWTKTYSTAPYKEFWTGELALKDFARDLPKAVERIAKNGGALGQPLENFAASKTEKTQQVSFSISRKGAKALVAALRGLGDMADPAVRPAGAPIPLGEVRAKIDAIMKEKSARAAELARVPAAAAAQEEVLEHLLLVEEVARRTDAEVRFNLLVRQK